MHQSLIALGAVALACAACAGPSWVSKLPANSRQVALALNDPADSRAEQRFDPTSVPDLDAPTQVRPCCAFGMDLKAQVGSARIPGYENANITSVDALGLHGYGDGLSGEGNGLVYTCRGGFIDISHVRDNADRMLYLTTQIARSLPTGFTVKLPDEGTQRRVVIKPLPSGMLDHHGRFAVATAVAQRINFQLSIWHEILTFYEWESFPGYSEKVSAFTPEDLYSNVLGQRIAAGIIVNREIRSRDDYNQAMSAWISEALRRLGAVSREEGRLAMKAVDGLWWDSRKALPDWKLVLRRYMDTGAALSPWLVAEALPKAQQSPAILQMCSREPPALVLEIPEHIGGRKIDDLASLEFEFAGWIPAGFPLPISKGTIVTPADFPALLADIHREGGKTLGPGFDSPRPPVAKPLVSADVKGQR